MIRPKEMKQPLGVLALLVADYDEAIAWYARASGFAPVGGPVFASAMMPAVAWLLREHGSVPRPDPRQREPVSTGTREVVRYG